MLDSSISTNFKEITSSTLYIWSKIDLKKRDLNYFFLLVHNMNIFGRKR